MAGNISTVVQYELTDDQWRDKITDSLLAVSHVQWKQQHREAVFEYLDQLTSLNKDVKSSLLAMRFLESKDRVHGEVFSLCLMDNTYNVLRTVTETPPVFATLRYARCTAHLRRRHELAADGGSEQGVYMAGEYINQWILEDRWASAFAGLAGFFISTCIKTYKYRLMSISHHSRDCATPVMTIDVSDGLQTVSLEFNYGVLHQNYRELCQRIEDSKK